MAFKTWLMLAALLGAFGVALGAFGAHALSATLTANGRTATFETASRYHLIHAVAIFSVAILASSVGLSNPEAFRLPLILLTAGTFVFCGSLYILAIFNIGFMGAVAPIGGTLLIAGWLGVIYALSTQAGG